MDHVEFGRLSPEIDTTPGNGGPFSPPHGWKGSEDDYLDLMRSRYKHSLVYRQRILVFARRMKRGECCTPRGPFKKEAISILRSLG